MCRGFQPKESERLKIKGFYTQLSSANPCTKTNKANLPDFLTLHYLPRIDGSPLQINGSNIRPDSPAFVTLHRVISKEISSKESFIYWSREIVSVCEGVRFEIYIGDVKLLKGIYRKLDDDVYEDNNWKIECKCGLLKNDVVEFKYAEVCVETDGPAGLMRERVDMTAAARRIRRRRQCCELDEIPEVREFESSVCVCCDCDGDEETDGTGDCQMPVEMENVWWDIVVDVGILAVCCIGAAASSKILRRKRFL